MESEINFSDLDKIMRKTLHNLSCFVRETAEIIGYPMQNISEIHEDKVKDQMLELLKSKLK